MVDDAASSRAILRKVFIGEYQVLEAASGKEALEQLHDRPDISAVLLDIYMPEPNGFGVLAAMKGDETLKGIPVVVMTASTDEQTLMQALSSGAMDVLYKPINAHVTRKRVENLIAGMDSVRLSERNRSMERELHEAETDIITGIYNKNAFLRRAAQHLKANPDDDYILMLWDIDNFKIYNDIFGAPAGDAYLRKVGDYYRENGKTLPGMILYARYEADHFVCLRKAADFDAEEAAQTLTSSILDRKTRLFDYSPRIGLYRIDDKQLDVTLMCDRALLALQSIKDAYGRSYAWYESSMRDRLVQEHEIVNEMKPALKSGQFQVYFQPQYNYTTGALTGAEALVRWVHPLKGVISPALFIPIFEKNGFIYELDRHIWEQACHHLQRWKELGIHTPAISVSVNISRKDLHQPDIVEQICDLPKIYGIQPSELHLEITESAYIDNPQQVEPVVTRLRERGFHVEMDDFGSGYSSLNTLKDLPVDMLKLDMRFLSHNADGGKSGKILSAIIRMAYEIDLPVIAEGVETRQQADFLKSIGCHYMQGFYFSRPLPANNFETLLRSASVSDIALPRNVAQFDHAADFMDANTQSTLLFNSFVGGAAILEYRAGTLSALRLNDRFFEEIGSERQAYARWQYDLLERLKPESRTTVLAALKQAINSGEESEAEVCSLPFDGVGDVFWTKCRFRCLSQGLESTLFYMALENITMHKRVEEELRRREQEYLTAARQSGLSLYRYSLKGRVGILDGTVYGAPTTSKEIPNLPEYVLQSGLLAPESVDEWRAFFRDIDSGKPEGRASVRFRDESGLFRWLRLHYTGFSDGDGRPASAVISYCDVTAETETLRLIQQRADTDGMTGVLNHAAAELAINQLLTVTSIRSNAFLLLDIDNLKRINDTYGHPQGDKALTGLANILKQHFRSSDILGRVGGDEFVVLLPGMESPTALEASMKTLLKKLDELTTGSHDEVRVHCSIGCAFCRGGQDDFSSVYQHADAALYRVKRDGKNGFAIYSRQAGSQPVQKG